jgi:hypothetical protein
MQACPFASEMTFVTCTRLTVVKLRFGTPRRTVASGATFFIMKCTLLAQIDVFKLLS